MNPIDAIEDLPPGIVVLQPGDAAICPGQQVAHIAREPMGEVTSTMCGLTSLWSRVWTDEVAETLDPASERLVLDRKSWTAHREGDEDHTWVAVCKRCARVAGLPPLTP